MAIQRLFKALGVDEHPKVNFFEQAPVDGLARRVPSN